LVSSGWARQTAKVTPGTWCCAVGNDGFNRDTEGSCGSYLAIMAAISGPGPRVAIGGGCHLMNCIGWSSQPTTARQDPSQRYLTSA